MLFSEKDRQIYTCPVAKRAFDPLAVRRALIVETRNRFDTLCKEAGADDPVASANAVSALIAAARKAFNMPAVDAKGGGVLDAFVYDALIAFTGWLAGKEPRARTTPEPSPSSDSPARATTTPGSG